MMGYKRVPEPPARIMPFTGAKIKRIHHSKQKKENRQAKGKARAEDGNFGDMVYHILNGDALASEFPLQELGGQQVIIKEAFMEGPVSLLLDIAYWKKRAQYIEQTYGDDGSHRTYDDVLEEIMKLGQIKTDDEVCLWFEDDLFCQVNMWFTVFYITRKASPKWKRIFPVDDALLWRGFGMDSREDLQDRFNHSVPLEDQDVNLAIELWCAFVENDIRKMSELSNAGSNAFRHLDKVLQAQIERLNENIVERQPNKMLNEIMQSGHKTFAEIFYLFSSRAGIYGYGDAQVRNILAEIGKQP